MKCPSCKEVTLVISERKGIEIDYCPDCRGVWLDRGELDKIIDKSQEHEPAQTKESQYSSAGQYRSEQKPYKRRKSFFEELFD